MNQSEKDVLYLCACALRGQAADPERIGKMDLSQVYEISSRHKITGIITQTLSGTKEDLNNFIQTCAGSIRRAYFFENAWKNVREELEKAGIWYMPLKGAVLQHYYPVFGMREMTDYDVLIDPGRTADIKEIMENLGYQIHSYDMYNHDVYIKPPVLNFEMHRALFAFYDGDKLYKYYQNLEERLIPKEGHEYTMSPEDQYIYIVAHSYKHYYSEGMGLRPLFDIYLYLQKEKPDSAYVDAETEKMGIQKFEHLIRSLSVHLIEGGSLTPEEEESLEYILSSGHYGSYENQISNQIGESRWGKLGYVLQRLSVPINPKDNRYKYFADYYPLFYRHKILLPLLPVYRVLRSIKSGSFSREADVFRKA